MQIQENCEGKTDAELVFLSLKNNKWFLCLLKRYEQKLLRYIRRISGFSQMDAEDALQEVFIKTYYNLSAFDTRLKFSSWIYRIAHNETVSQLRKRSIRPTVFLDTEDMAKFQDSFSLEEKIKIGFEREKINLVLSHLDEKYREVLVLRFLDDREYADIADILHKPISTVGNLIARGKKLFRFEYEKIK